MIEFRANPDLEVISTTAAQWVARQDAGLSTTEQRELNAWLAENPRHKAAFDHFAGAWSVLDRPGRDGSAVAIVRAMDARRKHRRRRRIGVAAVAIFIVAVSGGLWQSRVTTQRDNSTPSSTAIVRRPETRTLPDGSIIELRPGATVTANYRGPLRQVVLQKGEAHFQVAPDNARPFVVSAGGVETRAVGTAFAVQLGSKAVEVIVTEGCVAVCHAAGVAEPADRRDNTTKNSAAIPSQFLVEAGRRLVLETTTANPPPVITEVSQSELAARLAWRGESLEFTGTRLAEAVQLMNRSNAAVAGRPKIMLVIDPASPGLAAEPVSGLFRAANAETFVHMLELSLGVQAERRGENEIILRKAK